MDWYEGAFAERRPFVQGPRLSLFSFCEESDKTDLDTSNLERNHRGRGENNGEL
jgi:hypothetical protein